MDKLVHDVGYGFIARKVMRNKDLSVESKAIYSYLASFAGTSGKAFPSVELMVEELGMSKSRFYKYMKELKEQGFIKVEQEKEDNRFKRNVYYLIDSPCTRFEYTEIEDTQFEHTENRDTNNNNLNNNNLNINKDKDIGVKSKNDFLKVVSEWNKLDENIPKVSRITKNTNRGKMLQARIKQYGLEEVLKAIRNINESEFLKGYINNFTISFDWFVKPNNFLKVLEGNYKNKEQEKIKSNIKTTGFHNFKQLSDDYDEDHLEKIAKRKREQLMAKIGGRN